MAAMDMGGFLGRFFRAPKAQPQVKRSKLAHDMAVKAHRETKGPTPELQRVYKMYLDNKNRGSVR